LRQLVAGQLIATGVCWNSQNKLSESPISDQEVVMVDVRKMVYLMMAPVLTALICWAIWLAL